MCLFFHVHIRASHIRYVYFFHVHIRASHIGYVYFFRVHIRASHIGYVYFFHLIICASHIGYVYFFHLIIRASHIGSCVAYRLWVAYGLWVAYRCASHMCPSHIGYVCVAYVYVAYVLPCLTDWHDWRQIYKWWPQMTFVRDWHGSMVTSQNQFDPAPKEIFPYLHLPVIFPASLISCMCMSHAYKTSPFSTAG